MNAKERDAAWSLYKHAHYAAVLPRQFVEGVNRPGVRFFRDEGLGFLLCHKLLRESLAAIQAHGKETGLLKWHEANQFPAISGSFREPSFTDIAWVVADSTLCAIERVTDGPEAADARIMASLDDEVLPFKTVSGAVALRNYAAMVREFRMLDLPDRSIAMDLWKETYRVTGEHREAEGSKGGRVRRTPETQKAQKLLHAGASVDTVVSETGLTKEHVWKMRTEEGLT